MKYKFLATLIASALLAGCNNNDDIATKSVQAFDGAIWGIEGQYDCDGGISGSSGLTDYDGFVKVTEPTFIDNPETCAFEFVPTDGAIDTSNGKDMSKVSYKAPKGLFSADAVATASPITTLIAKELGDEPYNESTATQVLEDLGLGAIANDAGINVTEFLQDTESSLKKIKKENTKLFSEVVATTVVLSDTIVAQPDADVAAITDVTFVMTATVLEEHPNYPESNSGEEIVVDLTTQLEDDDTFKKVKDTSEDVKAAKETGKSVKEVMDDADLNDIVEKVEKPEKAEKPERPVDPETPPPATGGTGGAGSDAGTGL